MAIKCLLKLRIQFNLVQITRLCNYPSENWLWNSVIRFVFSTSLHNKYKDDNICTIQINISGPPVTNFTENKICFREKEANATTFSILFRLSLPENIITLTNYMKSISNFTKVKLFPNEENLDLCNSSVFPPPLFLSRPFLTNEVLNEETNLLFQSLVDRVVKTLTSVYSDSSILTISKTFPFLSKIDYSHVGSFACINTSSNCQGSTWDSLYLQSNLFYCSYTSYYILIGAIHSDFMNPSFYSSISLYQLMNVNVTSGSGVLSIIDNAQRYSALGYFQKEEERVETLNHFYVATVGYNCLDKLPSSTICEKFFLEEGQPLFFLTRIYANPGPNPDSLIPEIILQVQIK